MFFTKADIIKDISNFQLSAGTKSNLAKITQLLNFIKLANDIAEKELTSIENNPLLTDAYRSFSNRHTIRQVGLKLSVEEIRSAGEKVKHDFDNLLDEVVQECTRPSTQTTRPSTQHTMSTASMSTASMSMTTATTAYPATTDAIAEDAVEEKCLLDAMNSVGVHLSTEMLNRCK